MAQCFEVNRKDFRDTRTVEWDRAELAPGQVRLEVERFAFTANNISYALSGDMLDYWGFFPTEAPWGRIPTMGIGAVVESANPDIVTGGRYFGFYPMSTEHVVEARANSTGFVDIGAHRADHAAAYTGFIDIATDPGFPDDRVDEALLLRGLFMTSFLVDDFLDDNGFFGAEQTLVTSASSKTSIALAHCLAARGHRGVGITSAGNRGFVEDLGLYDEVISYDDIESLDGSVPSVVVDMAGDAGVRSRIHRHFDSALTHSCQVGATHWEQIGDDAELPGPTPAFFFAPSRMAKRNDDWGPGELMARVGESLGVFLDAAPSWLTVEHSAGPDAVERIYRDTLEGRASASTGHILSMSPSMIERTDDRANRRSTSSSTTLGAMDALTALRTKRDTRAYEQREIEREILDRLLGAARMAGSAKNVQPVRMVIVTDPESKAALTAAGDFAGWIGDAPVVVVVTVRGDAGPRRMFDVGRHAQNLMVAAHAEGLASCPVTIHHPDVARSALGIPDEIEPAMIVTLGRPARDEPPSPVAGPRVSLRTYALWDSWA